jgi:hypothetical protein
MCTNEAVGKERKKEKKERLKQGQRDWERQSLQQLLLLFRNNSSVQL